MLELLTNAYENHYAIPAFNFDSFDVLFGIFDGAVETQSPLIVQITPPSLEFLGIKNVVSVVRHEAERRNIPTALHLDHADNLDIIRQCVEHGFTSVMLDYSDREYDINVTMTQKAVELCRSRNVTVEGEIGHVGILSQSPNTSSDAIALTDIIMAADFYKATEIDVLGIAIGNIHGVRTKERELDIPRLTQIHSIVPIPLALHGSSGTKESDLQQVIYLGVAKVNIETRLRLTFRRTLDDVLRENPDEIKPRNIMRKIRDAIKKEVISYQNLLQSAGRIIKEQKV
jgi:ketose-bisphosphate aldolase